MSVTVRAGATVVTATKQGPPGARGEQGIPGVDATPITSSTDTTAARVAMLDPADPGKVRTPRDFRTRRVLGTTTATQISGTQQAIQHRGPIDRTTKNLGPGLATAVGFTATGDMVRVTDPTCVSGLNFVGYCDEAGTITVDPRQDAEANVLQFGLDPTGATACDAAFAAMCAVLDSSRVTAFYFPAGKFLFERTIDYLPVAVTLRGDGVSDQAGARFYPGSGTRLVFSGPGDAIVVGNGTNTSSGGCIRDLEILGILNTDVDGQATFQGTAPTGAVDPTNINDRGIHLFGCVGFVLRDVRMGGFKRQISVDGGGSVYGEHIEFTGGGDGYGYQSMLDPSHKPVAVTAHAGTNKYTLSEGSWIAQGFKVGRVVNVGRDPHFATGDFANVANKGPKTIVAVTDLELTVAESLADETATRAWFKVDLGDDSARAIEIGSFDFEVPVSANVVAFDRILFNNTQVGVFHQSGVAHTVSRASYEIPTWAWLQSAANVLYHSCSGEGAQSAALLLRHTNGEGSSSAINLTVDNCLPDPHFPMVAPDADNPCNANCLVIRGSEFESMGLYDRFPVEGASRIAGLFDGGGNRLPASGVSEGALCDGYTTPSTSAIMGTAINHATKSRAALHVNLFDYSFPLDLLSSEGADYYARLPPASQRGKEAQQWRQVLSSLGNAGARKVEAIGWAEIDGGAASQTTAKASTPRDGAGVAILTASAHFTSDRTKVGAWQVRCRYSRASDVVTLGSPTTIFADNDDSFVAPVLTASGANIVATLSAHASEQTIWSVTIDLTHGAT